MNTLPKDDLELHEAIGVIALSNDYSSSVHDIAQHIYDNDLDKESLKKVLRKHGVDKIEYLKEELLDFILDYIKIILNDHAISDKERKNIGLLKIFFKIKEGDFYKLRYNEISEILHRQFEKIYADGIVTNEEEIHKFEIQDLFDLSYDQFLEYNLLGENNIIDSSNEKFDSLFEDAAIEVVSKQNASTAFLQRKFKLGYNRAGRIMDQLEREKIVGTSIGSKTREVLIDSTDKVEYLLKDILSSKNK